MRESSVAENYVRLKQVMYEASTAVMIFAVEVTDGLKVEEDCIKDPEGLKPFSWLW